MNTERVNSREHEEKGEKKTKKALKAQTLEKLNTNHSITTENIKILCFSQKGEEKIIGEYSILFLNHLKENS